MNLYHLKKLEKYSLREKGPYSELFWSAFFYIQTEYGEIRSISRYLVPMRVNMDQKNSEYGHFLRSDSRFFISIKMVFHNPLLSASKISKRKITWIWFLL